MREPGSTSASLSVDSPACDALSIATSRRSSILVDRQVRALLAKPQNDWDKTRRIETVPGAGDRFVSDLDTEDN